MKMTMRIATAACALALLGGCGVFKGGNKKTPVLGERVPILTTEGDVVADKTIADVSVTVPEAVANTSWAQPGGNSAKAMIHVALGDSLSQAWSVRIPGGSNAMHLAAAPVVAGGRLYAMDSEGAVHAMSADSGAAIWTHQTAAEDSNRAARFGGGVSVDGERVYAVNGVGDVVALDGATGAELWRTKPSGGKVGSPLRGAPTLANGNIYVLSQDNQMFALSQADGTVLWNGSGSVEAQGVFGVAPPAAAQGTVVVGYSSGELNAYRYENGRALWADTLSRTTATTSVSALSDIDAAPVIDQGRVYAIGQGGRMVALEIVSGQRIWEQSISGIANPWVAGEWVFVVTSDARLVCIARANGKIRWISQLKAFKKAKNKKGPISWVGPVLAGNRLIVMSSLGDIVSASLTDGSVTSTLNVDDADFTLGPVVANNTLYTLADDGRLIAWR